MPRGRGNSKISATQWTPFSGEIDAVSINTSIVALATFQAAGTILRTRGEVLVAIDGPTDADAEAIFWGLMVTDEDRVAAGATAFPDIGADTQRGDFFVMGVALVEAYSGTQDEGLGTQVYRGTFDSKAMRKFDQSDQVVLVAQAVAHGGTPSVEMLVGGYLLTGS